MATVAEGAVFAGCPVTLLLAICYLFTGAQTFAPVPQAGFTAPLEPFAPRAGSRDARVRVVGADDVHRVWTSKPERLRVHRRDGDSVEVHLAGREAGEVLALPGLRGTWGRRAQCVALVGKSGRKVSHITASSSRCASR